MDFHKMNTMYVCINPLISTSVFVKDSRKYTDLNSLQISPQHIPLNSEITLRSGGLSVTSINSSYSMLHTKAREPLSCMRVPRCSSKHNKLSHFRGQYKYSSPLLFRTHSPPCHNLWWQQTVVECP